LIFIDTDTAADSQPQALERLGAAEVAAGKEIRSVSIAQQTY